MPSACEDKDRNCEVHYDDEYTESDELLSLDLHSQEAVEDQYGQDDKGDVWQEIDCGQSGKSVGHGDRTRNTCVRRWCVWAKTRLACESLRWLAGGCWMTGLCYSASTVD